MFALLSLARKQWTSRALVDLPIAAEREEVAAGALALARQKRRAAQVLHEADCPAEALQLAVRAVQAATALIEAAAVRDRSSSADATDMRSTLQAWGLDDGLADRFLELGAEAASMRLPATDERLEPRDVARCAELLRVCRAVETAFEGLTRTRRQRLGFRLARVAVPAALLALVAFGGWLTSLELPPRVTAHGTWSQRVSEMGPRFAIDLDPKTEWVGPDASPGWLVLRFFRERDVRAVVLRNGNNRGIRDRAVRDYRIELYRGEELLAQAAGSFPAIEPNPIPVEVAVQAERVDRIVVSIDSFHGFGPALADIEVQ